MLEGGTLEMLMMPAFVKKQSFPLVFVFCHISQTKKEKAYASFWNWWIKVKESNKKVEFLKLFNG